MRIRYDSDIEMIREFKVTMSKMLNGSMEKK